MGKKLVAAVILILTLVIGRVDVCGAAPAGGLAMPVPADSAQIAAIKQLNDTFFEVMCEYSDLRQEYLADKQQDRDARFIPRVEALYKKISSARRKLFLFKVSPDRRQALSDAQQNSLRLASSIFEFYDALLTGGDYRSQQLVNSAKDYEKALPYYTSLSVARQAPMK